MILKENLSKNLLMIKAQRKLSILSLSEEAEVSRSTMQNILKGSENLSLHTVECIANGLGIDILMLFSPYFYKNESLEINSLFLEASDTFNSLDKVKKKKFISIITEMMALFIGD